jgi:Uma2 family endonuclease
MTMTSRRLTVVTPANHVPGPRQGHWTYSHYAALPEDGQRYEIVDGVLYMAPSPSGSHQDSVLGIAAALRAYMKATSNGKVWVAPFDVELAPDTIVQPDVLILLKQNLSRYRESRIIGAPDLVVEVASPATAIYDRRVKYDAYAQAGIPEYWIVDPAAKTVEVLVLEADVYHSQGVFRGTATLPSTIVPDFDVPVEQFFM